MPPSPPPLGFGNTTTRRYQRATLDQRSPVWADVYAARGGAPSNARVAVLGLGGAFLELRKDYSPGSLLGLRFRLPPTFHEVICWAVVRDRLEGRGVGVEFSDLAKTDARRIDAFVTARVTSKQ